MALGTTMVGHKMASAGVPTAIHTTAQNQIGDRMLDDQGNEYVYLKGAASLAAGVWVSYNAITYQAVILTADGVGSVALAMAAVLAANWGWFMVKGFYPSASSDTVAGAGGLFIDGTPGRVDDASVAGDYISGAVSTGADVANVLPVQLNYPMVGNTVPA